ncbi:MAG: DUF2279 domain-containing protein [Sphingobacteriales bacterium]|nr:DUF2279 domain-containing protein [Sphingobacteriales bacterium]MBI3718421.1 DUF2279 domain-containing protein [Sphingobacteriales bacterium]
MKTFLKKLLLNFLFFVLLIKTNAQDTIIKPNPALITLNIKNDTSNILKASFNENFPVLNSKRVKFITAVNIAGYGGSLILLNQAWYSQYPRSSFHFFNDNKEWLQMDKVGHVWTAYNTGKASAEMWKWTGMNKKKAAIIGGLSGAAYLTVIEILDGFSKEWGFSPGDMAANVFGSGLFLSQELAWGEQRILYKFSFHRRSYGEPMLNQRADKLFGNSWYERMLKDYNGQAYWFSANLKSFFPQSNLPAWLNLSVGYGADGMFGGFENVAYNDNNNVTFNRRDIKRYRQWYLAPDIDFTKIKTNKKWLRTAFHFLNAFKFPAPALELSNGKLKAHAIYF